MCSYAVSIDSNKYHQYDLHNLLELWPCEIFHRGNQHLFSDVDTTSAVNCYFPHFEVTMTWTQGVPQLARSTAEELDVTILNLHLLLLSGVTCPCKSLVSLMYGGRQGPGIVGSWRDWTLSSVKTKKTSTHQEVGQYYPGMFCEETECFDLFQFNHLGPFPSDLEIKNLLGIWCAWSFTAIVYEAAPDFLDVRLNPWRSAIVLK